LESAVVTLDRTRTTGRRNSSFRVLSPKAIRLAKCLIVLCFANFATFVALSIYLGGDALNGHAQAGRYFLANHGVLTEVSRTVFMYSKWHSYSLVVSLPVLLIALFATHATQSASSNSAGQTEEKAKEDTENRGQSGLP
jgi:hypothetical protein